MLQSCRSPVLALKCRLLKSSSKKQFPYISKPLFAESKWKFNSEVLLCTVNETHLASRHVFTPYALSVACTSNQASSHSGGEAVTVSQHRVTILPRDVLVLYIRHQHYCAGIRCSQQPGWEQNIAFIACNECVDCF